MNRPRPTSRSPFPATLLVTLLAAACASGGGDRTVPERVAHGEYEHAVYQAEQEVRDDPGDSQAIENYRLASVAFLLDKGRRDVLEGRNVEAMEKFLDAAAIAPDAPEVRTWIEKTADHLADSWAARGYERHLLDDLPGARDAYEKALIFRPDDPLVKYDLNRVLIQLNHRLGLAEEYYEEGVRALADYWIWEAKSRFAYTGKYDPDHQRARERAAEVRRLLADQRLAVANELEREEHWAAAANEYRLALLLEPDSAEATEGLARARIEVEASELLSEAQMEIVRDHYDEAAALIDRGERMTKGQTERFLAARDELEQARFSELYERARNLERDHRFPAAVVAYEELLGQADFYDDAIARKQTLESFILRADELWRRAEAEEDPARRASLLAEIEIFWPGYPAGRDDS